MTGNLDEVMKKLKKSKKSKDDEVPEEVEEEEVEEDEDDEEETEDEDDDDDEDQDDDEDYEDIPVRKPVKKVKKPSIKDLEKEKESADQELAKIRMQEVEILQNDGIFRVELLHRLDFLNSMLNKLINGDENAKKKK